MGMLFNSSTRRIKRNPQRILVNRYSAWQPVPDLMCDTITRGVGTAGSSANFIIPKREWSDDTSLLSGAEVMVLAGENNTSEVSGQPWFHGWLVTEPRRRGPRSNSYSVSALSVTSMLDKIPVGLAGWTSREWNGSAVLSRTIQSTCARYPRLSGMRNGRRVLLWHPKDVIFDIFQNGLPTYWAQAVGLGNVEALNAEPFRTKGLAEWDFTGVSVLEALETLLSAYGDVAFVERYTGGNPRVVLDFARIGDVASNGRRTITIPTCAAPDDLGVQEIGGTSELADTVDRVILAGGRYKTVVTAWTGDLVEARRLRRGWVVQDVTIDITRWDEETQEPVTESVTKTNEEWVLDDPDYGRRGSDLFKVACEYCFRRYFLPPCLLTEGLEIDRGNAVRQLQEDPDTDNPKRLDRQVFKSRLTMSTRMTDYELAEELLEKGQLQYGYGYDCGYTYGQGYGYETAVGFRLLNLQQVDLVGELVPDVLPNDAVVHPLQLLDNGTITDGIVWLTEPAINVIYKGYCGSKEQIVRAEAEVAVTLTVAREDRLTVDTGQPMYRSGNLALIGNDGLILSDIKDEWEYSQVTNLGNGPTLENGVTVTFPFTDPDTGAPVYFPWCVYQNIYDPDADNPDLSAAQDDEIKVLTHVFEQQVVKNDYPILRELARSLLKLRSQGKRTFEIKLPIATRGFAPGMLVNLQGVGSIPQDDYTVVSVDVRFDPTGTGYETVLNIDNSKPEESVRIDA